jgi:hypothetical protein
MGGIEMTTDDFNFEAAKEKYIREAQMNTPAYMLMPYLSIDGDQWCALHGENLQDGVAGFGDSPAEAYDDFNKNWVRGLSK